jgi:hypothetical protein
LATPSELFDIHSGFGLPRGAGAVSIWVVLALALCAFNLLCLVLFSLRARGRKSAT